MSDVSNAMAERPNATADLGPEAFAAAPNDGETQTVAEAAAGEIESAVEGTQPEADDDPYVLPPEFWSAERRALWERVTDPETRKAIHETEKERASAIGKRLEQAASERKAAAEKLQSYEQERDQLVGWWADAGPKLAHAFKSKWETVDWNELAANNPSEYVRLTHERDNDFALMRQTAERHHAEMQAAQRRARATLQETRLREHDRLVEKYPDHFSGERAQKTYDELRDYLLAQDVPADRIPHIYESFVVGVALKAMLYDRAQETARRASSNPSPTTATQTPRRIAPGASTRSQPGQSDAYRQAQERLNNGEKISEQDARLLFA